MASPVVSFNFPNIAGPQVDEMLFPKAAGAGVNRGNAEGSMTGAIIRGAQSGVQKGIATTQGIQQIGLNEQQQELNQQKIDNAPAQQQQEAARTKQMELQNQVLEEQVNNGTVALEQKVKAQELQQKAAVIQQKNGDFDFFGSLAGLITGSPQDALAAITSPENTGALLRNPAQAQQAYAGLKEAGIDPTAFAPQEAATNGALAKEAEFARLKKTQVDGADAAAARKKEYDKSLFDLSPVLKAADVRDYSKLGVVSNSRINTDSSNWSDPVTIRRLNDETNDPEQKGFSLVYDGKVISQYESSTEANKARADIGILQSYQSTAPGYAPPAPVAGPNAGQPPVSNVQQSSVVTPGGFATGVQGVTGTTRDTINGKVAAGLAPSEAIQQQRKERAAKAAGSAAAIGGGTTGYNDMIASGRQLAPAVPTTNTIVTQRQDQPTPPNQPSITQPVEPILKQPANPVTTRGTSGYRQMSYTGALNNRLTALRGGIPTKVNLSYNKKELDYAAIERTAALPELQGYNALIKGIVSVESAGNPRAVGPETRYGKAKGLMQMLPGAMKDVGGVDNPFDPAQNIRGGAAYVSQLATQYGNAITKESAKQGIPITPDPRILMLAYNGGFKWVQEGLAKGYTTWDEMRDYMYAVKNPALAKQNVEYAEKVIANSIAFMNGGNAADDSLMQSYLNFGIAENDDGYPEESTDDFVVENPLQTA